MKKLIPIITIFLLLPIVNAHQETTEAGITPDSFLWGLDKAIDQLSLLLTFNKGEKAKKGIEIARERLLEVKEMIEENKLEAAEKAKNEELKVLLKVKKSISDIKEKNATKEIEEEIEIERELEEHEEEVKEVSDNLKIKIEVKGTLSEEQKALINSILSTLENKTGEVKVEIKIKKDKTKIKIKAETGKPDEEIEDEIEDIEEDKNLTAIKKEKAAEEIEDAKEDLEELEEELLESNVTNVTAITTLINNAKEKLAKAEEAFKNNDFGEAYGQANAAGHLIENAERILEKTAERFEEKKEKHEEKKEIKVEIEEAEVEVKIEIGDTKLRFTLETIDKNTIIQEIATRTGLSIEEVTKLVEFEEEKEKKKEVTKEEVRRVLRLGESVKAPNGYGVKFTGLPFAECPSGLPKEVQAEVSGVELTLIDQNGQSLRNAIGNEHKIIICKGDSEVVKILGNLVIRVLNFRYAEYPLGKPEIPPTAEIILTTASEEIEEKGKKEEKNICKVGGCSGQLCGEASFIDEIITTCEYKPEYECYKKYGKCEMQSNGKCGWTQTKELSECMEKGKKENESD